MPLFLAIQYPLACHQRAARLPWQARCPASFMPDFANGQASPVPARDALLRKEEFHRNHANLESDVEIEDRKKIKEEKMISRKIRKFGAVTSELIVIVSIGSALAFAPTGKPRTANVDKRSAPSSNTHMTPDSQQAAIQLQS